MFGGTNLVVRMHKLLSAPTYIVFNRYFSFSRFNRFKHELLRDFDNSKFSDTKFTCRSTRVVLNLVYSSRSTAAISKNPDTGEDRQEGLFLSYDYSDLSGQTAFFIISRSAVCTSLGELLFLNPG